MAQTGDLPTRRETQVQSLGWKDPLKKGVAIHSSILAWRTPWAEEPGGLQSMGLQRVGHDWATNTFTFTLVRYGLGLGLTTRAVLTESFIWALCINTFGNLCTLNSGKPNYPQVCVRLRCGSSYFFLIFLFLTFNIFITSMLESRPRQKNLEHYLHISGFLYLCNSLFCVLLHNL